MYCNKCGDIIDENELYCNKCGNYLGNTTNTRFSKTKKILIGVLIGLVFVCGLAIFVFRKKNDNYYFSSQETTSTDNSIATTSTSTGKYKTVIITTNTYNGIEIKTKEDAYELISEDSTSQKSTCSESIIEIENEIIDKFGISAVNLCEMDVDFARELVNVLTTIYDEYPQANGTITNLSLVNLTISERNVIAEFKPVFYFATSNTSSGYPNVIKTQILLNASYFLNIDRLESSVAESSSAGWFPENATRYSSLAHELGHYISYLAMMNYYDVDSTLLIDSSNINNLYNLITNFSSGEFSLKMLKEAYTNSGSTSDFDEWRGTISKYALSKDDSGNYIYDETVAEAFHDVYLNGDDAESASKYIVEVLKKYLEM